MFLHFQPQSRSAIVCTASLCPTHVNSVITSCIQHTDKQYSFETQDGYAVVASEGPGDYVVAFAAHAGHQQPKLESGSVAYITTGVQLQACCYTQMTSFFGAILMQLVSDCIGINKS